MSDAMMKGFSKISPAEMDDSKFAWKTSTLAVTGVVSAAVIACLYFLYYNNFLLFHFLVEMGTVALGITVFAIGWHTRKFATTSIHLVIAVGLLYAALTDCLHLLFYKGMPLHPLQRASDISIQMWVVARAIQSTALLASIIVLRKQRIHKGWVLLLIGGAAFAAAMVLVFKGWFPVAYSEGAGLTEFKVQAEYIICAVLITAMILLQRSSGYIERRFRILLMTAMGVMVLSELSFTFYEDLIGYIHFIGHILKLVSFVLIYRAIVVGVLTAPYYNLFYDLATTVKEARSDLASAAAASSDKSAFLASVSHEIRTPMNSVLGLTTLLLDTKLTPLQERYAAMTHDSAKILLGLINEILEYSKLEVNKVKLEHRFFNVREVVSGVVDMFDLSKGKKAVVIEAGIEDDVPVALLGDPDRLRQILVNLAGNALKFTEKGRVAIGVRLEGDNTRPDGKVLLVFEVRDTGIGIPEEDIPNLFLPYEQAGNSSAAATSGTGLGLAISKKLVELMGGSIKVDSRLGEGSCFTFTAAFGTASGVDEHAGGEVRIVEEVETPIIELPAIKRVFDGEAALIADDNRINRIVAAEFLEKMGFTVYFAETGKEAVDASLANDFKVILMDFRMPVMGGLEATAMLRAKGVKTPIVGLTAATGEDDRCEGLKAGMDHYLTKPIDGRSLYGSLVNLLAGNADFANELAAECGDNGAKPGKAVAPEVVTAPVPVVPDAPKSRPAEEMQKFFSKLAAAPERRKVLTRMFLDDCRKYMDDLETGLERAEIAKLSESAHALRGCLAVFGANTAGRVTLEIENAARAEAIAPAERAFRLLKMEMDVIRDYLEEKAG